MAETKSAKKPTDNQRGVLALLTPARIITLTVTTTTTAAGDKKRVQAAVTTRKGKAVELPEGVKVNGKLVEALAKAGWIGAVAGQAGSEGDTPSPVYTVITEYEITDEGKQARKRK